MKKTILVFLCVIFPCQSNAAGQLNNITQNIDVSHSTIIAKSTKINGDAWSSGNVNCDIERHLGSGIVIGNIENKRSSVSIHQNISAKHSTIYSNGAKLNMGNVTKE